MTDGSAPSERRSRDWAGNWRRLAGLWGLPLAAMVPAIFLPPAPRGIIWVVMLVWMGSVCLANAYRCGRTHCWVTGPFFLIMAALVAAYASGMLPLGPHGWTLLGAVIALGFPILWWGSERLLGRFANTSSR